MNIKIEKIFLLLFIIFLFSSCVQKNQFMGYLNVSNFNTNFNLIHKLSKQCFEQQSSLFSDGILVKSKKSYNSGVITFHRYAFDIGIAEPFIILKFKNNKVDIYEGPYNVDIYGYKKLKIKTHIQRWLNGDIKCKKTKEKV